MSCNARPRLLEGPTSIEGTSRAHVSAAKGEVGEEILPTLTPTLQGLLSILLPGRPAGNKEGLLPRLDALVLGQEQESPTNMPARRCGLQESVLGVKCCLGLERGP